LPARRRRDRNPLPGRGAGRIAIADFVLGLSPNRPARVAGLLFGAASILAPAAARAAELPALHSEPSKSTDASEGGHQKDFDVPGTTMHVTFGGYIEGAAVATNLKSSTISGQSSARQRKAAP